MSSATKGRGPGTLLILKILTEANGALMSVRDLASATRLTVESVRSSLSILQQDGVVWLTPRAMRQSHDTKASARPFEDAEALIDEWQVVLVIMLDRASPMTLGDIRSSDGGAKAPPLANMERSGLVRRLEKRGAERLYELTEAGARYAEVLSRLPRAVLVARPVPASRIESLAVRARPVFVIHADRQDALTRLRAAVANGCGEGERDVLAAQVRALSDELIAVQRAA